jgi:CheY-like chemotaxis protein
LGQSQKIQGEGLHNQRKKKRILVVDDEHDICMVYQIVLQDAGYECVSYTDSVKALQEFTPAIFIIKIFFNEPLNFIFVNYTLIIMMTPTYL